MHRGFNVQEGEPSERWQFVASGFRVCVQSGGGAAASDYDDGCDYDDDCADSDHRACNDDDHHAGSGDVYNRRHNSHYHLPAPYDDPDDGCAIWPPSGQAHGLRRLGSYATPIQTSAKGAGLKRAPSAVIRLRPWNTCSSEGRVGV